MTSSSLIHPTGGPGRILHVTPDTAGWDHVEFGVVEVGPDSSWSGAAADRETAIVPLAGEGRVVVGDGGMEVELSRESVFTQMAGVVYLPPGTPYRIESEAGLQASVGSAPAEGRYPVRVFDPSEMRIEIRGGGQAYRQVVHSLSHPLPAERLILYEVYVPRGTWSGWPPHCHDGRDGSPYLEEVYYFRLDRPEGYAIRFTDLTDLYSSRIRQAVRRIDPSVSEGVYAGLVGPHFETPAEITMLARMGADLVGMSTVLEAIAVRHLGAEVAGVSLAANAAAGMGAPLLPTELCGATPRSGCAGPPPQGLCPRSASLSASAPPG